jgi:hypothetical protein
MARRLPQLPRFVETLWGVVVEKLLTPKETAELLGLKTATLTGVVWNKTVCPDGTNSSQNGGTCAGHL